MRTDSLRIFDCNLRQAFYSAEILDTSLQLANVLKVNDEELPVIADLLAIKGDEASVLGQLEQRYSRLRLIALTRGGAGSLLYSRGRSAIHGGFPATVADTVGAGDAFAAALSLGLLKGWALEKINESANRVAAWVCSRHGATPELPRELCAFFDLKCYTEGVQPQP